MKAIPGGSVVETLPSNMGKVIPGQGAKFPHASWSKTQNIKQRQYCNMSTKDSEKNDQYPKKKNVFIKSCENYLEY